MSPGSRPNPYRASHGMATPIAKSPTTITRSHFTTASFRVAAPLERDSHLADVAHVAQLRDGKAHPRRLELAHHDRAHVLRQGLEELEPALRELAPHALDHVAV